MSQLKALLKKAANKNVSTTFGLTKQKAFSLISNIIAFLFLLGNLETPKGVYFPTQLWRKERNTDVPLHLEQSPPVNLPTDASGDIFVDRTSTGTALRPMVSTAYGTSTAAGLDASHFPLTSSFDGALLASFADANRALDTDTPVQIGTSAAFSANSSDVTSHEAFSEMYTNVLLAKV